jgi:PKD repeat protein
VTFDVAAPSGANLTNVRIDFGDGDGTDLGAIVSTGSTPHAYCAAGQFTATATATDVRGDRQQLNTNVIIGSLPAALGANPPSPTVGVPVVFTVSVTGTTTAQVSRYTWIWDDGTPSFTTTAPQTSHTFTGRGQKTVRVDITGVGCGTVATATIILNVS